MALKPDKTRAFKICELNTEKTWFIEDKINVTSKNLKNTNMGNVTHMR